MLNAHKSNEIGRAKWWGGQLYVVVLGLIAGASLAFGAASGTAGIAYFAMSFNPRWMPLWGWVFFLLGIGLYIYAFGYGWTMDIKRFHDHGKSGWWTLLRFAFPIPYIGWLIALWYLIYMGFWPGKG